ncbi:MAG: hypothetical protein ABIP09_03395 [Gemmatimonadaceae bacterium]
MAVMTKKHEALLDQLMSVAGDPAIVEEALRSLNEEAVQSSDLGAVIRRILEIKQRRNQLVHAAR